MRFLILTFVISYWGPVFAQDCMNWIAQSEVQNAINLEPNAGSKVCGGDDACVCFDGIDWETAVYADITEDDLSKPIHKAAYNVVSCADKDQSECAQMAEHEEFCIEGDQGYVREEGGVLEAYCTGVVGYDQKVVGKRLQEDPQKKSIKKIKEEQEKAMTDKIQEGRRRAQIGSDIVALIVANNDSKNLSTSQSAYLASQLSPIIQLLTIGSIETAKAKTLEIEPDGVLILQEDLDLALKAFQEYGF